MLFLLDIVLGLISWGLIQASYAGFRVQAPNSYASLSETHTIRIYSRLWRVALFRFVPLFLVSTLMWTLSFRWHGTGWMPVLIGTVLHIIASNGRGFVESMTRKEVNYGSYHLLASAFAASGAVSASLLGPYSQKLVPSVDALAEAFWTALFGSLLVGAFLYLTRADNQSDPNRVDYLMGRAVSDAGISMYDYLFLQASKFGCNPIFAKAVMTVEILQRPRWMRRAERFVGSLITNRATYGVMQMKSSTPISDEMSIHLFVRRFAGRSNTFSFDLHSNYIKQESNPVWDLASEHNGGDGNFNKSLVKVYDALSEQVEWVQTNPELGMIGVIEKRRYPSEWGIRVMTNAKSLTVYESSTVEWTGRKDYYRPLAPQHQETWYSFEHRCPIGVDSIYIHGLDQDLPEWPVRLAVSSDPML